MPLSISPGAALLNLSAGAGTSPWQLIGIDPTEPSGTKAAVDISAQVSGRTGAALGSFWGALALFNDSDVALLINFPDAPGDGWPLLPGGSAYLPIPSSSEGFTVGWMYTNPVLTHPAEFLVVAVLTQADLEAGWQRFNPLGAPVNPSQAGGAGLVYNVKQYGARGDGSHDDTTAIQAAISAAQNAAHPGGIVWFPAGTYITSSTLVITQGITLQGAGGRGVGSQFAPSRIRGASGMQGDLVATPIPVAQGNAGFIQYGVRVLDLEFDGSQMAGTTAGQGNCIHFYGCRYSSIERCHCYSYPNWAILLDGDSTNFSYWNAVIDCNTDSGAAGILINQGESQDVIRGRWINARSATAAPQPTFGTQSTNAYHLWSKGGYILVEGNVFDSGVAGESVRVDNNGPCKFLGNKWDTSPNQAIHLGAGGHMLIGNHFINCSAVGSHPVVELGSSDNVVVGNEFDSPGGPPNWTYCIAESSPQQNNTIADNRVRPGTLGTILVNPTGTGSKVHHNAGYNPAGPGMAQIPVPASGTPATNTSGVDATVVINALNTLTAVALGGTAVPGAPAQGSSYRVPAGGTITYTYGGAAPTVQCFGD